MRIHSSCVPLFAGTILFYSFSLVPLAVHASNMCKVRIRRVVEKLMDEEKAVRSLCIRRTSPCIPPDLFPAFLAMP